jgi:hypothetical protein
MSDTTDLLQSKLQSIFSALGGDAGIALPPDVKDTLGWWLDMIIRQLAYAGTVGGIETVGYNGGTGVAPDPATKNLNLTITGDKLPIDNTEDAPNIPAAISGAVAQARLASQKWLPAVRTKAGLPDPDSLAHDTSCLCRVINDADTPDNNGVWQLIANAVEWTYFSDNLDFVDEMELEDAVSKGAQTTLESQSASSTLPAAGSPLSFGGILQTVRNNLRELFENRVTPGDFTWNEAIGTASGFNFGTGLGDLTQVKAYYSSVTKTLKINLDGMRVVTPSEYKTLFTIPGASMAGTNPRKRFAVMAELSGMGGQLAPCLVSAIQDGGNINVTWMPALSGYFYSVSTFANCVLFGDFEIDILNFELTL